MRWTGGWGLGGGREGEREREGGRERERARRTDRCRQRGGETFTIVRSNILTRHP